MKNEITLKGDTLSQLDFNLTPQDIVLNCSDGQVWWFFCGPLIIYDNGLKHAAKKSKIATFLFIKGGGKLTFTGSHLALHTTTSAGMKSSSFCDVNTTLSSNNWMVLG